LFQNCPLCAVSGVIPEGSGGSEVKEEEYIFPIDYLTIIQYLVHDVTNKFYYVFEYCIQTNIYFI